ncbi:hypothetical protein CWO07_24240 [Vibrio splendidus]|uniref:ApeA N-terminal domain-containing protein n=1 Tax=Vibrio splendidus TaxID=29497 RepID=A0A2T5EJB5_VIBSP|nr:HEPN domain-containing protein [Vibrio splendidus]PTP20224.1 hypothetical protein CWO07_24240 [Vibrio splendidus]
MFTEGALNLNTVYEHNVIVNDGDDVFFGKLTLSPEKCILKVMSERRPSLGFSESTVIECSDQNKRFVLYVRDNIFERGLSLKSYLKGDTSFLEYVFEIAFAVCFEGGVCSTAKVSGLTMDFDKLKTWVGYTKTQQNLMEAGRGNAFNVQNKEFNQVLEGYGQLELYYEVQTHGDHSQFSSGMVFPPKLSLHYDKVIEVKGAYSEYKKLYELLTNFMGSDFQVESVELIMSRDNYSTTSLYFPLSQQTYERDYLLFPLSKNLRYPDRSIPELPLASFSNYFQLPEGEREVFSKYLSYQRMQINEERFLGYFRLLERLTLKKKAYVDQGSLEELLNEYKPDIVEKLKNCGANRSDVENLMSRVKGLNKLKYNTLKCILDFYKTLPSDLTDGLSLKQDEIKDICALRNDITHANPYTIKEADLKRYTAFINMLLYLALLKKIGIHTEIGSEIVHHLNGFHLIREFKTHRTTIV